MSYATEAPDADCEAYTLHDRTVCYRASQMNKNVHPAPTESGFDFFMNLYNHV